jgi:hypothetical protein
MRAIERATRADLKALPAELVGSALARVAIDLARRLDEDPGDRDATALSRELRMVMADLREQGKGDAAGEVEQFLRRVSTPSFNPAD